VPLLNGVPWWFFQGIGGDHDGRVLSSVDPGGRLAAALPARAVVGAVVYVGASREGPARITWNGRNRIVLGEPARRGSARLDDLARVLQSAGIGAEATPDIRAAVWAKLLGNATYNPLSAITGATMGRMAEHPPLRAVIRAIMVETVAVGRALGVIEAFDVDERLNLSPAMRAFRTSMLQDMDAGRPLELAGIVDAVVELADLTGVDVPVLRTVGALAAERWAQVHGGVSSP
jgi:2-dehydropantoate 2-reductase